MLFPTVEYALFFLAVLALAWPLAPRPTLQKLVLLAASYVFYGCWSWRYVPLLFAVSLGAGLLAQAIQRQERSRPRRRLLQAGIVASLLVLVYYKYTAFLLFSFISGWGLGSGMGWSLVGRAPTLNLPAPLLPLGISFFIFHVISLLVDVYRRKLREPLQLLDALLYVAFFPQLIAGPILRASRFIPQLLRPRDPQRIRVNRAFLLILSGLFKKVILSNTLATRLVDPVFADPAAFHRGDTLLAIYGYAAQIYCDFSGYTDIAIGSALLLGFRFPRNFNAPYTAANPQQFWQRWHISLSTWLRDYLYIPLGGSHNGPGIPGHARTALNIAITMLLGGLWHGASWTFVAWGALHAAYLISHRLWCFAVTKTSSARPAVDRRTPTNLSSRPESSQPYREDAAERPAVRHGKHVNARTWLRSTWLWLSRLLLFHAVCLAWVFFRSPTFALAGSVFRQLGSTAPTRNQTLTLATWPVVLCLVLGLFGQYAPRLWRRTAEASLSQLPLAANGAMMALGIYAIELLGPTGVAPFIYFQF